ncbi:MAG: hypothetical protein IKP73_08325 [Bacteroidales bacterium]|nr:hypothetical protein [Bacteroidales bacterium]MBR4325515.1 hypothetical protein [Bacteroidales bacterium]
MSRIELRGEFLQCINLLLDDDRLMREAMDAINDLLSREEKAQTADAQRDSDEEIEVGTK